MSHKLYDSEFECYIQLSKINYQYTRTEDLATNLADDLWDRMSKEQKKEAKRRVKENTNDE